MKVDADRSLGRKGFVIVYYWSLSLSATLFCLLAITLYSLFTSQPHNTQDADEIDKRPVVAGMVLHRLKTAANQHGTHSSSRGDSDESAGLYGQGGARDEWKKYLPLSTSEKMQQPQPNEDATTRGGASTASGSSRCAQPSKCEICAGNGSTCCDGVERKEVFLAIMCKSAPINSKRRQAVRRMWDQMILVDRFYAEYVLEPQVYFAFVLGKVKTKNLAQDKVINDGIEGEANIYGDMVVGDFLDSYTNLTTKLLFTFDWLRGNLRFRYLMMADDDTFINIFGVLQWLVISPKQDFYAGKLEKDVLVVRDPESKWYVHRGFYGPETYPPYHQGFGYVVSCDAVERAMSYIQAIPLFGIDDTVMGMLMYVTAVKPVNMPRFFPAPYFCQIAESSDHPLVIGDVELDGFVRYTRDILYIGCPVCHRKSAAKP